MKDLGIGEAPKLRRDTVTNHAYEAIRQRIMELKFQPGQALSEKDLSTAMGVSRTPVREAFIRLERQGLLCIYPQRGTYVSKISQKRILEERFFRETLEEAIFREYLQQHTEKSLAQLKYHIDMQRLAYQEGAYYQSLEHDDGFHQVFYQDTDHGLCAHILKTYSTDYQRVRLLSILGGTAINEVNVHQHEEILEAILVGNHQLAVDKFCAHVCKLNTEMERILQDYPSYFREE